MVDLPGKRQSRAEQTQLTRERLLAAAADVFIRRGFFAATFEEISALAGYTRPTVYKHFRTKTEIYRAFVAAEAERRIEALETALNHDGGDSTLLSTFGAAVLAHMTGPGQWQIAAMEYDSLVAQQPELHDQIMASERRYGERVGELLARLCQSLGVVPPLALEELTIVVASLALGLGAFSRQQPDLDVARLFTDVLNALLSGGCPAPPSNGESPQHSEFERVDAEVRE